VTVAILIPTYNEAFSLPNLIGEISRFRETFPEDISVYVIDDNSPDKSADVVDKLNYAWVTVLRRGSKDGLGPAYRHGIDFVLQQTEHNSIITMDADGSHQVNNLKALLDARAIGIDLVIGTRWMQGGSVKNWPQWRKFLSQGGTSYARKALGIDLKDLTGGFRIYSRELLASLSLSTLKSSGYCFQIEMAMQSFELGANIHEVPIEFIERVEGKSKMSTRIVLEALWQVTIWGFLRAVSNRR
jgi:dolichol-phosphate mannosyltransferase